MDIRSEILALSAAVAELAGRVELGSAANIGGVEAGPAESADLDFLPAVVSKFVTETYASQWCAERGFETHFVVGGRPVVSVSSICGPLAPMFANGGVGAWNSLRNAVVRSNRLSYRDSLGVLTVDNHLSVDGGERVFIAKERLGFETPFVFADSLDRLLGAALKGENRVAQAFGLLAFAWAEEQQLLDEKCSEDVYAELRAELSMDRWAGRFGELAERASVAPDAVFGITNGDRPSKSVAIRLGRVFGWRRQRVVGQAVSDRLAVDQRIGFLLEGPSGPSAAH